MITGAKPPKLLYIYYLGTYNNILVYESYFLFKLTFGCTISSILYARQNITKTIFI